MSQLPTIDQDACIGCEVCEQLCPEVFKVDDAIHKSIVINPTGAPPEKIEEAMDNCPAACIYWQDA